MYIAVKISVCVSVHTVTLVVMLYVMVKLAEMSALIQVEFPFFTSNITACAAVSQPVTQSIVSKVSFSFFNQVRRLAHQQRKCNRV